MGTLRPWLPGLAGAFFAGLLAAPEIARGESRHLTMLGIPSATVAPHGTGFLTLQYGSERPGPGTGADASLTFGVGFGDADETIGVQLSAEITSMTDDFADSGYLGLNFSRRISAGATPVYLGVGVWRLGAWGDAGGLDPAFDLSLSFFPTINTRNGPAPLMVTLGAGTDVRANDTEPGVFAGVGYGFSEEFGASAAWYGDHATIGVSYAPRNLRNVRFSAALVDVTNETGDRRAVAGVTLIFPKMY